MRSLIKLVSIFSTAALLAVGSVALPASAAAQRVSYFISGECNDNSEMYGEYALYEEYGDTCVLEVRVSPKSVVRTVHLQYWSETRNKWISERTLKTNKQGVAKLDIEPYCEDDLWCDGTYTYRIYVLARSGQKANYSQEFDVTFYPYLGY